MPIARHVFDRTYPTRLFQPEVRNFVFERDGQVRFAQLPMPEVRLRADGLSRLSRSVDYVREDGTRIPRPESFNPGNHELRLAKRETVIVRKLSIARNG